MDGVDSLEERIKLLDGEIFVVFEVWDDSQGLPPLILDERESGAALSPAAKTNASRPLALWTWCLMRELSTRTAMITVKLIGW